MGLFAGIKHAQITSGGNYIRPGTHKLGLLKLTQGRTRVKALAVALLSAAAGEQVDENTVDEEAMEQLVSEGGNDVAGVTLMADAFHVDTRRGGTFTKIVWSPVFDAE